MEPSKQSVYEIFQREIRYTVPLFQRAYVWKQETHWEPLWEDIERQALACIDPVKNSEEPKSSHFLGAVVLNNAKVFGDGHPRSEVIDGQQRLTTLQIFLAALRDFAAAEKMSKADIARRLTENPVDGDKEDEIFKVWPTIADQDIFKTIMTARSRKAIRAKYKGDPDDISLELGLFPRMVAAYLYFYEQIEKLIGKDKEDAELRLSALILALKKPLQFVKIELDEKDDPQVIFESLNARGQPLLPSDLIRNFVFLQANQTQDNKDRLYELYWKNFDVREDDLKLGDESRFWHVEERQGRLTRPRIDLFVFHYLVMKIGNDIQISHLYKEFRTWYESWGGSLEDFLKDLCAHRDHFSRLVEPEGDTRLDEFARRLKSLDTSTLYPVLLYLMGQPEDVLPRKEFDEILNHLESWMIRRLVCGLTNKNYNRFFLGLLNKLREATKNSEDLADCVFEELTRPLNASVSNGPFPEKVKKIAKESDLRINAEFRDTQPESWDENDIKARGERLLNTALEIWGAPPEKDEFTETKIVSQVITAGTTKFEIRHKSGVKATAVQQGADFIVLQGSQALKDTGYAYNAYAAGAGKGNHRQRNW